MGYRNSTTANGASFTPAVTVPSGAAVNDIAILACGIDAGGAVFAAHWPSGFTGLADVQLTADGHRAGLAWKRLTANDTGSYTLASTGSGGSPVWVCDCLLLSGRSLTSDPTNSSASSNSANASPVSVNAATVTAVAGDDLVWISIPDVNASGIANGHTPPTNYTEYRDDEATWSNVSMAVRENATAGATGTVTGTLALTSGGSGWAAFLVRVPEQPRKPLLAAGSIPPALLAMKRYHPGLDTPTRKWWGAGAIR